MRRVVGEIRVQSVRQPSGGVGFTIVRSDGTVDELPDSFLRQHSSGTSKTYAYLLVDHLRWLEFHGLATSSVDLADLKRYLGVMGAEFRGPLGRPWRVGEKAYGQSSLKTLAACLKAFYVFQGGRGVNRELAGSLKEERLPSKADRSRSLLGHLTKSMPANPLAPTAPYRRHPKLPPEGARRALLQTLESERNRLIVTWLSDGGFRIGELCGLHLVDLHLREGARCGECRPPHVHIVHRETNPNNARVKVKHPWAMEEGTVRGGAIRRVSPAMIHTYFKYMLEEYPRDVDHGFLLVQQHGTHAGRPLATAAVRGMLKTAGARADVGRVRPHAFRHQFATDVLAASNGNALMAREAGGWASALTVEQVYGHPDLHSSEFSATLNSVWDAE